MTGLPLDPVELVLALAAAQTVDELAAVRLAAIRSGKLRAEVPAAPDPYQGPAGVWLLGGLTHDPAAPQTLSSRVGRITRRHTHRGDAPGP